MATFPDLTLITCSFNTPEHTKTMLKSFVKVHGPGPFNIIVMENSTNDETSKFLSENGIFYISNKGGRHSQSIDELIFTCNTKYALLVDTDIVFKKHIGKLLDVMKKNGGVIMGEICGNRGGYNLKTRMQPWFCLLNTDEIKGHHIRFHDQKRINETGSNYFYESIPINPNQNNSNPFYDVGATFYEDINNAGLKILDARGISSYYSHYEGSSWQRSSGNQAFINLGNFTYEKFKVEYENHKHIDTKGKFKADIYFEMFDKKIILIQPCFCPNQKMFAINKRSLISILEYISRYRFRNIKLSFGGYFAEDKHYDVFSSIINEYNTNFNLDATLNRFNKNYGKAYIVNSLFRLYNGDKYNYLFTMDSDIVFDINEYDIIRRLLNCHIKSEKVFGKELGMISLNQKEHCCHVVERFDRSVVIDQDRLLWSSTHTGVAGGCLMIDVKSFINVGLYRIMGVYAGEDGYLLYDFNTRGIPSVMAESISVIHPKHDEDEKYSEWKKNKLDVCRESNGKRINAEEHERMIAETAAVI